LVLVKGKIKKYFVMKGQGNPIFERIINDAKSGDKLVKIDECYDCEDKKMADKSSKL